MLNLEQRGALMLTGVIVLGCVHVKDIMMMFSACPADPAVSFSPAELQRDALKRFAPTIGADRGMSDCLKCLIAEKCHILQSVFLFL